MDCEETKFSPCVLGTHDTRIDFLRIYYGCPKTTPVGRFSVGNRRVASRSTDDGALYICATVSWSFSAVLLAGSRYNSTRDLSLVYVKLSPMIT